MLIIIYFVIISQSFAVTAYSNQLYTITKPRSTRNDIQCSYFDHRLKHATSRTNNITYSNDYGKFDEDISHRDAKFMIEVNPTEEKDPLTTYRDIINKFLFGETSFMQKNENDSEYENVVETNLLHYPTGRALRKAELFNEKSGVHLPISELILQGNCLLNVTKDYMQTAVDAFHIFLKGDLADIERLPSDYVLNSARTISMLTISHEKLAAAWNAVKGSKHPKEVTYETLEKYRPLFKYLSGKEMADLNLKDPRILHYIGTHPDLTRHQVGLVASKYIMMNQRWSEPKYLNIMNNLLCGVPITYMRDIPENTYLQLSHQVFYHTRACDPLQRRFYLSMMTRTQALGKSYSWNAQDVSRLGLLLAELEGEDLGAIKPEALAGLTARVVMAMNPAKLQHLTEIQLQHIRKKPFNILSKKINTFKEDYIQYSSATKKHLPVLYIVVLNILIRFCSA